MTSNEISSIEAYNNEPDSRLSRLGLGALQQRFHLNESHECSCVHHRQQHNNFSPSNGPFNHLNQHMHPIQQQQQREGILIYNNRSSSDFNQTTNDSGSNTIMHYTPTSNLSALNIMPSCECVVGIQQHHHHQRQSSTEQSHSIQSGRSSRIISCDENNPSGTDDGASNSEMIMATTLSNSGNRVMSKGIM